MEVAIEIHQKLTDDVKRLFPFVLNEILNCRILDTKTFIPEARNEKNLNVCTLNEYTNLNCYFITNECQAHAL